MKAKLKCPSNNKESRPLTLIQALKGTRGTKQMKIGLLRHALMHLEANSIYKRNEISGWYIGDKEEFIEKHEASMQLIMNLIKEYKNGK